MSDILFLWASEEKWGNNLNKLAMMFVAQKTEGCVAYGVNEDTLASWSEMDRSQARATLKRLHSAGHLVLVLGKKGPAIQIGQLYRGEPIVLQMRAG